MIFHTIICSSFEFFSNLCPLVSKYTMLCKQDFVFVLCPLPTIIEFWGEVIMPPAFKKGYLSRHCLPVFWHEGILLRMVSATSSHLSLRDALLSLIIFSSTWSYWVKGIVLLESSCG